MRFMRRLLGIREESLESLFHKRADKFREDSNVIFKRIPNAMEAVREFLGIKAPDTLTATLIWNDVSLAGVGTPNPIVILMGVLEYPPGTQADLKGGEKVVITVDTKDYFRRLVQFGFPLNIIHSSKEDLMEYLKKTDIEKEKEIKETIEVINEAFAQDNAMIDRMDDDEDEDSDKEVPAKNDTVTNDTDFDLTQLTEEQRKRLDLSIKSGKR